VSSRSGSWFRATKSTMDWNTLGKEFTNLRRIIAVFSEMADEGRADIPILSVPSRLRTSPVLRNKSVLLVSATSATSCACAS
jgi:hypothetical protein